MPIRMIKYFLLCCCWLPLLATGQVKFTTVPGTLQLHQNEVLQVTYMIENAKSIDDFRLPAFRDFKVVQGPIQSEGSIVTDGQFSQYSGITYVLQPLKKGNLQLPGATALVNGKKMTSNKITIEVGDRSRATPNPYPRNPGVSVYRDQPEEEYLLKPKDNASEKIKNNLVVALELDKKTAYVGEPIVSTYKLYTRLRSESRVTKRPSLNGFSVYDMVEPDRLRPTVEKKDGKKFMSHIIRKTQLIPLQEGDFVLEPMELDNKIHFLRMGTGNAENNGQSAIEKMFEGFFDRPNGTPEDIQVTIGSAPQTVHIKPLPAGAPESFNGAVGRFSVKGSLADTVVKAGEPVQYDLQVEGAGNLPLVTAPAWNLPHGVRLMDPTVNDTIDKSVAPMEGSKTFHYTITPDSSGRILLPSIEFSYFDPASATYKKLHTDSVELLVEAARPSRQVPRQPPVHGNSISTWMIAALAGTPLVLGLLLFLFRKKKTPAHEPVLVPEPEPEVVIPRDPLAAARLALANDDATNFYHALQTGLWEVITDKLALPGSAQQQPQVLQQLAARGLDNEAVQQLKDIWNTCDWILYLPAASHQIQPELLPQAEKVLAQIREL